MATPWQKFTLSACAAATLLFASMANAADKDPLTKLFEYWNAALISPEGLTKQGMSKHLSSDAVLIIDGGERARGLDVWLKHFGKIGASDRKVQIVLPFRHMFQQGDKVYTYHVIRSRDATGPSCMLAAGHALLKDGKITEVNLVRTTLDAQAAAKDPDCYKS